MSRTRKPRTIMAALAEPHRRIQPVLARAAQVAEAFDAELLLFHSAFESALSGRLHFDSKRLARARGWRLDQHMRALDRHARKLRRRSLTVHTLAVWKSRRMSPSSGLSSATGLTWWSPVRTSLTAGTLRFPCDRPTGSCCASAPAPYCSFVRARLQQAP